MTDATIAAAAGPSRAAASGAQGSSFYAAMRLLPAAQRNAMFEIYGFCRAVDDIADDPGLRAMRLAELEKWRDEIRGLYQGKVSARTGPLAEPVARFGLAEKDFQAVIDGMEMDVHEDIRAPAAEMLDLYCDRVASAVGRLSVKVFGIPDERGEQLARNLGRALQLTNILRDIDEDAERGRLYLPADLLAAAGIASTDPDTVLAHPALAEVCQPLAETALGYFIASERILSECPRRAGRAPRLMAKVYGALLRRLIERGWQAPREPVRLSRSTKLWMLLRHGIV